MTAADRLKRLADRLPPVRGRLTFGVSLASVTWFGVGGPADVLFKPADAADLADFLADKPDDLPVTVLGVGSNLLVRDGGVRGVVVRLGRAFAEVIAEGDTVRAGSAALDASAAKIAQRARLTGLEFLSGIPGTVGGAVVMNAGAYGREIKDALVRATVLDPSGFRHFLTADDLGLAYRRSALPEGWIVTEALFRGAPGDAAAIAAKMAAIRTAREESQPLGSRTGGSTFANPPGYKAWELVDRAGCRGLRIGGAVVSEKHCNFLVNAGGATAADIETLGEEVRRRVLAQSGIELTWEIRRIGEPLPEKETAR
ncbi:UDP-N-acetylenolpyruvoylglucosamine reductase [uncultured Alphaproteobacteria bacterium]|uniref:UDP-N-acetylenolpyruvoylglucosamine reductase n=1 Tax=uncultured Alphaproteobacteria bacterium TaxID=91750 RepID=A0A212JKT8_9PROT|nr:UDP-N-acetylenolpyruvoylglucosamine reductase [uncultured Alphaproteobacteria bacterium]